MKWLARRVAATLALLYAANAILLLCVIMVFSVQHPEDYHKPVTGPMAAWLFWGVCYPFMVAAFVAFIYGIYRLGKYWASRGDDE